MKLSSVKLKGMKFSRLVNAPLSAALAALAALTVMVLTVMVLTVMVLTVQPRSAAALEEVPIGWCAKTVTSAATPFAVATKMGWYKDEGIAVRLQPLGGSGDCTKQVANGAVMAALASVEPAAILHLQGLKMRVVYTAYQGNIYGIAVREDSPIHDFKELKGKRVGLIAMGSAGAIVARALAALNGMDPDTDIHLVVAGEGAQSAAMVRSGEVDALSQFDTQYAIIENAGVKLRLLDTSAIDPYPSNGFVTLEEEMGKHHKTLVAVTRGYAKGTIVAINNPQAAVRMLWEVYPQTKPTGKDEATALADEVKVLNARAVNWRLEKAHAKKWGENVVANYEAYMEFLHKWGVIKSPVPGKDMVSNEWINEINNFNAATLAKEAKAYR